MICFMLGCWWRLPLWSWALPVRTKSMISASMSTGTAKRIIPKDWDIPRLNVDRVTSPVELEKFKARVRRVALYTALCSICLGLEDTGRFSPDDLHRIFLAAYLTEAEIAAGQESYDDLERNLLNKMVQIEMEEGDA